MMYLLASLWFGAWEWRWAAFALLIVGAAFAIGSYAMQRASGGLRVACAALKLTGFALLAFALLDPQWSRERARPGENLVLLLADNSQSMRVKGKDKAPSVGDEIAKVLADDRAAWLVRLKQDFDVRLYQYDQAVQGVAGYGALNFDGNSSNLNLALGTLRDRFAGRRIAAVLLFSDGRATDPAAPASGEKSLPPVYSILPAAVPPAEDWSIDQVTVTQSNFEDAPVTAQVDARGTGDKTSPLACELLDARGKVVERQVRTAPATGLPTTFRFQFRPPKPGVSFYKVRVVADGQEAVFEKPETSREATLANNARLAEVDRRQGPYRILYVGGRPNWEFKFLRRAIESDTQVQLVALMRIAKREPKFDWRSRAGESSNPLFRGFKGDADEQTERYDQPVLIRLNTRDGQELRDGFPKTAEALFDYHAIILDDIEAEFFSQDQMPLLKRFVGDRGGGLMMLGGQESFTHGEYRRTPIADLLPVYLDRVDAGPVAADGYQWQLTREGWLVPWLRLRRQEGDDQQRLASMPPFKTLHRISGVKPGASVLAQAADASGTTWPAVVTQRFGRGQTAAVLVGDLWRWKLRTEPDSEDQEKSWRQMLRWLVSEVPNRVSLETLADPLDPQRTWKLRVRARDANYEPLENGTVTLKLTPPVGSPVEIEAEPALTEPGLYEASLVARDPGAYLVSAHAVDASGAEVGTAEAGWTADPLADEFRELAPDRDGLARLSQATGGRLIAPKELEALAAELPYRDHLVTEQRHDPLWHTPWVFVTALACLAGEWGLRRWRGLA